MPSPIPDSTNTTGIPTALAESERLLLWCSRTWVACITDRQCPPCPLEHVFGQFGITDAAAALHAVLSTTAKCASRSIEIHCTRCNEISEDEALLLQAASAAQRGEVDRALAQLRAWLPVAIAQRMLGPLQELGTLLRHGGFILPARSPQAASQERTVAAESYARASRTLH
jgi:hypothetical protein